MPTYKITLPGGETYRVESPSELTDAQAYAAVQSQISNGSLQETGRGGVLPSLAEGFATSFTGIPLGLASIVSAKPEETSFGKFSLEAEKRVQDILGIDPTKEATTAEAVAGGLGSLASFLVPGTIVAKGARGLGAGVQLARGLGYAATAGQAVPLGGAEQVQRRMGEEAATGVETSGEDRLASQRLGAAIGLSELIPLHRFMGPLEAILARVPLSKASGASKTVADGVKSALRSATEEGAQEALSQTAQNLVEQGYYNPDLDITEGLLGSAGVGGAAGGTLDVVLQLMAGRKAAGFRRKGAQLQTTLAKQGAEKRPEQIRADANMGLDKLRAAAPVGNISIKRELPTTGIASFNVIGEDGKVASSFATPEAAVLAAEQYEKDAGGLAKFNRPTIAEMSGQAAVKPTNQEKTEGKKLAKALKQSGGLAPAPAQTPTTPAGQAAAVQGVAQVASATGATPAEVASPTKPITRGKKRIAPVEAAPAEGLPSPEAITAPPVSTTAAEIPAPADDPVYRAAVDVVRADNKTSPSYIGRKLGISYNRAASLIERMEKEGVVTPRLDPVGDRKVIPEARKLSAAPTPPAPQAIPAAQTAPVSPTAAPPAAVPAPKAATPPKPFTTSIEALFKPIANTPEDVAKLADFNNRKKDIARELNKRLSPITGKNTRVKLIDAVNFTDKAGRTQFAEGEAKGGNIIYLSYNLYDPKLTNEQLVDKLFDVMNHEVIHSLTNLGVFNPGETKTLFNAAERVKYQGNQFSYYDRAYAMYRDMPNITEEIIREEAVAEMFRDYRSGKLKLEGTPKGLVQRAIEFFRRIFNGFRDAKVGQVFKDIESGKIGARKARTVEGGVRKFAIPAQLTGDSEEEFARWWGDGKHTIETADGTPVPVYTGTSKDKIFETFQEKDRGIWVSTNPEIASEYSLDNESMDRRSEVNITSRVIPLYARIKNPLDLSTAEKQDAFYKQYNIRVSDSPDGYKKMQAQAGRIAMVRGYDSIQWWTNIYAILKAKDLKSTFNRFEPGASESRKFSIIPTNNIVVKPGGTIPPSTPVPSPQEVAVARADTVMGAEAVRNRLPIVVPEQERVINGVYVVGTPDGRRWVMLSPQELAVRGPGFAGNDADLQKMWEDTLKEVSQAARTAVERTGASWKAFPAEQWDKALRLPLRSQLWYELSGESFIDGLPDLAYNEHMMFLDLVGATSARAEPKDNLERALAILSQRLRGVPIDVDITIASTVSDALRRNGTDISSALANKTGMFSDTLALTGGLPVRYPISVNDVWVGKAFGISDDLMSANQALHEAFAKYTNKLRDFVNANGGHQFDHQSWNLQARQWVELRAASEGIDTSVGSAIEGSDYAGEWAGIVKKLKAAGLPVKNNKITRDILLDPRFADALRPATTSYRDAPKATIEFGTLLTPNGRAAANVIEAAIESGDQLSKNEYLKILSTAMYHSGRGKPTLWQDTVRVATGESGSVTRIVSPTSEDPFSISGTFDGAAGPNIRIPLKEMTPDQIAYFNAVVGLGIKQKAMAAAEIRGFEGNIPSDYIPTKRIRFDFDGVVPEKMLTDFTAELGQGFEISVIRYPDGLTLDINPKFGENGIETVDVATVDRAFDVIKDRYGASNPKVFDVGFKSEYGKNYVEDDGTGSEYRRIIADTLRSWKENAIQELTGLGLDRGQADAFINGAEFKAAAPSIKVPSVSGRAATIRKRYEARIDYHNSTAASWNKIGNDVDRAMGEAIPRWIKRLSKKDPAMAAALESTYAIDKVLTEKNIAKGIAASVTRSGEATEAEVDIANQAVRDSVRKLSILPQTIPMPPEMEAANERIFAAKYVPSRPGEKLMAFLGGFSGKEGIMNMADMFRTYVVQKGGQITKREREAFLSGAISQEEAQFAEYSATAAQDMQARASHYTVEVGYNGAPTIMGLNAKREQVRLSEGADPNSAYMYVEENQKDSPFKVLEMIYEGGPNGESLIEQFRSYAIAQVSKRRISEGKEVPSDITEEYIAGADALGEQFPIIKQAFETYQRFNTKLLEAVRDSGYLSQELFEEFTDQQNYYSMYRQLEEGDVVQGISGGLGSRIRFKAYEGSTTGNLMADPIVAMMHNVSFWNNVILRTLATQKSFRVGEATGVVKRLRAFEDDEGNVTIEEPSREDGFDDKKFYTYINGVEIPFASRDPLFTIGLSGNDFVSPGLMLELAGMPANFLREMVTRDPGFMVANLLRDSVSTWVLAGSGANPYQTFKGMVSALKSSSSFNALRSHAVVGSFDEAQKPMAGIVEGMRGKLTKAQGLTSINSALKSGWRRLGSISEASDAATRIAVYEAAKRDGASDFTAAYRALSIMNFSRSGHSAALRTLTRLIPFLNARIQGFDVLYTGLKAATGVVTGRDQLDFERQRGTHVLVRGMGLMAATMALALINDDDEDYKELPPYVKDANILIPIPGEKGKYIQIPKPFEAGFLFMTVPETFYNVAKGDRSMRSATKLMFNQFGSTFGFNPIPQVALPILENMLNYDFYTGQPLVSPGLEKLDPSLQYNASTSYVARGLSNLSGFLPFNYDFEEGRFAPISPVKMDNLISGYGGPLISYLGMAVGGISYAFGADNQGLPVAGSQLPVIRRFFVDARDKQPQAATEAYELYQIVDRVNRTISRLKKSGDTEALKEYREENINVLRIGKQVRKMADNLNNIRAQVRRLEADKMMPMDQKLEKMRELRSREARVTKKIYEINQQLGR
jgi:hypothetical protein